jgi:hypothetical protein
MGVNPNDILLSTWNMLDQQIKEIKEGLDSIYPKAKARALCDVLALMMPPFFDTSDEIGKEALRRYENRDNPEYETPGLGLKSLAEHDTTPYAHTTPKKATPAKLDDATRANIKLALESKLFTASQLAKSYGVNILEIESCR